VNETPSSLSLQCITVLGHNLSLAFAMTHYIL
jgi:hypothetical protein